MVDSFAAASCCCCSFCCCSPRLLLLVVTFIQCPMQWKCSQQLSNNEIGDKGNSCDQLAAALRFCCCLSCCCCFSAAAFVLLPAAAIRNSNQNFHCWRTFVLNGQTFRGSGIDILSGHPTIIVLALEQASFCCCFRAAACCRLPAACCCHSYQTIPSKYYGMGTIRILRYFTGFAPQRVYRRTRSADLPMQLYCS